MLGADGVGVVAAVFAIPCYLAKVIAAAVFVVTAVVAATCGKLPFGLGGQAEVAARVTVEAVDKGLAIVPTHAFNRQVVAFEIGRVAAHDGLPKGLRHLVLADIVATECDAVGGLFVVIGFSPFPPHGECAA